MRRLSVSELHARPICELLAASATPLVCLLIMVVGFLGHGACCPGAYWGAAAGRSRGVTAALVVMLLAMCVTIASR